MKMDSITLLGISHKELGVEDRESFIQQNPAQIIHKFFEAGKVKAYVNLSTCLRVEFYLELEEGFSLEELIEAFSFKKGIFVKQGEEATQYLFEVSCGFYSIIKGEEQILAQIKKAHTTALEEKTSSKILNTLFNKAIELGKKFRTESKICHNSLSLEGISLKFIKDSIGFLSDKKVLILGVGDLAQAILYLLVKENVKDITITNRTYHKALELKNTFDVNIVAFEDKLQVLPKCDVIISVTSAPHLVLKYEEVSQILIPDKKYTLLDLAMPRDIEASLGNLENISLFTLEDIWGVYKENLCTRDTLIKDYSFMVDKQIENFKKWFKFYDERIKVTDEKENYNR